MAIKLQDEDAEITPVPSSKGAHIVEPELNPLSKIVMEFNDLFGNIKWGDEDNVKQQIRRIPEMVSRDEKYQNAMKNSDEQEAKTESEHALQKVMMNIMFDNVSLFKQFQDNESFKKWLTETVFKLTYNKEGKPYETPALTDDYRYSGNPALAAEEPKGNSDYTFKQ